MDQTFRCRACNAAQSEGPFDSESIRCAYCGAMVEVPASLRVVPVRLPPGFSMGKVSEGEFLLNAAEVNRIVYLVQHGKSREATHLYAQTFHVTPLEAKRDLAQLLAALANPRRTHQQEHTTVKTVSQERVVIVANRDTPTAGGQWRGVLAFWLIVGVILYFYYSFYGGKQQLDLLLQGEDFSLTQLTQLIEGNSLATPVLQFGSAGIGAGQFSDATAIAVSSEGTIFVAEAEGGRIQLFDAAGAFQTQWFLPGKERVLKMVADRQGGIWVLQGASLARYQAGDGQLDQKVQYGLVSLASDMAITMDESLVVAYFSGEDELVRFNDDLQPVQAFGNLISNQLESPNSMTHIAVDGMDTMYVLAGTDQVSILKYDASGKFLDRIENREDDSERFWTLSQIAVDGKGRLFATVRDGVVVMDNGGNFLGKINTGGYPASLTISPTDEIFVATAHQVTKYLFKQ